MTDRAQHLDYDVIQGLIEPGSTVLDLGCGDGELLHRLATTNGVRGRGVEIEEAMIVRCLSRGISVFQGNLNEGLRDHGSGSYDYVVLNQTLQVVERPVELLAEMRRVGKRVIVSFPNFGYIGVRLQLLTRGRMPVTADLPYRWYDTPNIHMCTRKDFLEQCREDGVHVIRAIDIKHGRKLSGPLANLRAAEVIFILGGAGERAGGDGRDTGDAAPRPL